MKVTCLIFVSILASNVAAQTGSEIYLFDLKISKDKMVLKYARNISNHKGYDNQPYFDPDKSVLYYVSADTSGRTNLHSYNYSTGVSSNVTNSPEREYSPTVTPDKKFISCIIQRDNGALDVGKYPVAGGPPLVVINNLTVGYHAWVDDKNLIAFVLGEPNTLRWISTENGEDTVLAENIGRSLHVIPTSGDLSFVQKTSSAWSIKKLDKRTKKITALTETIQEKEDLSWSPDGRIVMSDGQKLFFTWPKTKGEWKEIEMDTQASLKGISRISINSRGDKMAIVVAE
jgi:WD40-like Beta Propeller Repeat